MKIDERTEVEKIVKEMFIKAYTMGYQAAVYVLQNSPPPTGALIKTLDEMVQEMVYKNVD